MYGIEYPNRLVLELPDTYKVTTRGRIEGYVHHQIRINKLSREEAEREGMDMLNAIIGAGEDFIIRVNPHVYLMDDYNESEVWCFYCRVHVK